MTSNLQRHTLNTMNGERLEISYRTCNAKIQLHEILFGEGKGLQLANIWMNDQPAQYIKGFKAQIIQENAPLDAQLIDGKLYLFSNSFAHLTLNIQYKGTSYPFSVSADLKIKRLHDLINKKLGYVDFELYNQRGERLQGFGTLKSRAIPDGTILEIVDNKNSFAAVDRENQDSQTSKEDGMGLSSLPFVNFEDGEHLLFDDRAPVWRTIGRGLNLEGKCSNSHCSAYGKYVCLSLKTGVFYMHETCAKAICPMPDCKTRLEKHSITDCIFWDCEYVIEGLQENSTELFYVKKTRAPSDKALSFAQMSADHQNNIVNWDYLKITVTPLSSCNLF